MGELAEAFVAAQAEMPDIPKTCTATIPTKGGASFSYSYADLPSVLSAVRPVLHKHGLAVSQDVSGDVGTVAVSTVFMHTSGERLAFGPLVLAVSEDARAAGSAITYARRYSLTAALGIAPEDDDDAGRTDAAPKRRAKKDTAPKDESVPEISADEIAARLTNAARAELLRRVNDDKEAAASLWPTVLEEAGVAEIKTKADQAKVIAKAQEMFPTESEAPF